MAKLTKPQVVEKLTELGVAFDPEASATDLANLLKENTPDAPKGAITFSLKSGHTRTFDEATHGEDYETIADEFETTHKDKILKKS